MNPTVCWVCRQPLPEDEQELDAFGAHDECVATVAARDTSVRVT